MCANREECLRRSGFAMFPAHKLGNVKFVHMLRMAALNANIQQPCMEIPICLRVSAPATAAKTASAIQMFPQRLPVFALRPPDAVAVASLAPVMGRM